MSASSPFSKHGSNIPQLGSAKFRSQSSEYNSGTDTPMTSSNSSYHETCVPRETKERIKSAPIRTRKNIEYELCNKVKEEMKWTERCDKERLCRNKWEDNCGFLANYDQYGEEKPPRVLSDEPLTVFGSKTRPVTASREYGHRVTSSHAQRMQYYQLQMTRGIKRDKDLVVSD